MVLVCIGFVVFGLSACASPAELRQADETTCQNYGFRPGTPEFAGCLQQENLARNAYGGGYPSLDLGFGGFGFGGGGFGGGGIGFGF